MRASVEDVMPNKINPVGSEFQVNSNIFTFMPGNTEGTQFDQRNPAIATLSDGRFAVVYESLFLSSMQTARRTRQAF
jgi:hypothetical protein